MQKKFNFGKIDYNNIGHKINPVEVEIRFEETENGYVFRASGTIYNQTKTDCWCAGQCLDTISKYLDTPEFNAIYRLWKLYHLNDMHAGTREQEEAVDAWKAKGNGYDYTEVCEYLESIGLYEVEHNGRPYKYGHAWLFWPIPENDLEEIKSLF